MFVAVLVLYVVVVLLDVSTTVLVFYFVNCDVLNNVDLVVFQVVVYVVVVAVVVLYAVEVDLLVLQTVAVDLLVTVLVLYVVVVDFVVLYVVVVLVEVL